MERSDAVAPDLGGQSVVITRAAEQAAPMRQAVFARGGCPIEFPLLHIEPVSGAERAGLVEALRAFAAGRYAGLIVTSQNAVQLLRPLWREADAALSAAPSPVFAVGPRTAGALHDDGVTALTPERSTGSALVELVTRHVAPLSGARFLFPRAEDGRLAVIEGLVAAGAHVDGLTLYHTRLLVEGPALPPMLRIDWVTFMSPSAVEAFAQRTELSDWSRVACIGPTTAERASDLGLPVDVIAEEQSFESLLDGIAQKGR